MIGNDWDLILADEIKKDYFIKLIDNLKQEYKNKIIYPKEEEIFKALKNTSYKDTKVVILGQDPYHGEQEAEGLSFSVRKGIKIPPSLKNIFKELNNDLGYKIPDHGSLEKWSMEGVLLLNTVLTVEKDKPASHKNIGWLEFTNTIIKKLNEKEESIVFILWGNFAKEKKKLITNKRHYIIESAHPSPFSARNGFFNSKPFSRTNKFLKEHNLKEIDWEIK